MIVHTTRFIMVVAGALGGYATSGLIDWADTTGYPDYLVILILIVLGTSLGYLLGGIIGREIALGFDSLEQRVRELAPAEITLVTVGLVVGLVVAWLISLPLRLIQPVWVAVATTSLMFLVAGYLGVSLALLKRDEVVSAFPRFGPEPDQHTPAPLHILDTSAVIDGRFVELLRLGLLQGDVRLPRFVLSELQTLADSADDVKRARGRRGLDLLVRIQADETVRTLEAEYPQLSAVDDKLLELARDARGTLVTVDFNLTKVARVRDVPVVNLNEVAAALKPAYLPGETLAVHVSREGKEPGQGVGYLEDGTMVVIQEGSSHVGSDVRVEVTSVLQTSAGRMIFARLTSPASVEGDDADEG